MPSTGKYRLMLVVSVWVARVVDQEGGQRVDQMWVVVGVRKLPREKTTRNLDERVVGGWFERVNRIRLERRKETL